MSGPKRELPPIHVKITGDPSGGLKAIQDVVDASKQAGKDIAAAGRKQTKLAQKELDKQYDDIVNFYKKTLKAGKDAAVKSYKERQKIVKAQEKEFRQQGKLTPAFARGARKYAKSSDFDLNALVKSGQAQTNEMAKQERVRRRELNRRNREMDKAYATERSEEDKRAAARVKQSQNGTVDFYRKASKVAKEQEKEARQSGTLLPAFAQTAKRYAKSSSPDLNALVKSGQAQTDEIAKQSRVRRREVNRRNKEIDKAHRDETRKEDARSAERVKQSQTGVVDFYRSTAKAVKAQEQAITDQGKLLPVFAKAAKSAKSGLPDLNAVVKNAEENAKTQANNLAKANTKLATHVKNGAKIQAERAEGMKSAVAKERAIQQSASEELAKEVQKTRDRIAKQNKQYEEDEQRATDRRRMRRRKRLKQEKADQDRMVAERKKIRQAQVAGLRQRGRALGSQAMGAFSGGGMMGARADIYMHQETLKSMGAAIMDLVRPFAQVENYSIQMEAFAGSAEKAKDAIAQLQAYAVGSPYTLEGVLNASTVMMKYGAEVEHAVKMTKLLGDVAAGDTHKLELMALAVGQAQALGRFQGQELRQMVNAGFNPLAIAAKELAGPGADKAAIQKQMKLLQENMRAGALDSGIIEAALQIATSQGGDFAGLAAKQANTLTGLASQILETFDLFRIEIVKVFAEDLTALMKVTLQYVQALVEWAKNNKQAVKEWVNFVIQVAEAIALFSAAAMALAYLKWILGSFIIVLGPIIFMMKLLGGTLSLLIGVWRVVGTAAMVAGAKTTLAWLAATAPIWGIPVAIAAAVAAFTAITVVVEGFSRKGGFASVFHDGIKAGMAFLGFMYNLEHNLKAIFEGVEKNQGALTYDTLITNNPNMQLLRTAAKAVGAGGAFSGVEAEARKGITGKGSTGKAGYNTSMFKFGLPSIDTKSVLGGMDSMFGVSEALKPYLKPLEGAPTIGDKPNIDFSQFLGKASGGSGGGTGMGNREHAIRGSGDHAVRMYEYGESVKPQSATDPKQDLQKQMVDSLNKIEKNTRLDGPLQGGTGIEEAALAR